MAKLDPFQTNPASVDADALNEMSEEQFVKVWKAVVGGPPAIMLDSRADMVRMLAESVSVATPDPADASVMDRAEIEMRTPRYTT